MHSCLARDRALIAVKLAFDFPQTCRRRHRKHKNYSAKTPRVVTFKVINLACEAKV